MVTMRVCKKCKQEKPLTEFPTYKAKGKIYFKHSCKVCYKIQWKKTNKQKYWKNRDRELEKVKLYQTKNRQKIQQRQKKWYAENRDKICEQRKIYYLCNVDGKKEYHKLQQMTLKLEVFSAYSNNTFKCAICGEKRLECLSIDHVLGGGCKHRKQLGNLLGQRFYWWLKRNNFPPGYRVLCMNCQFIERMRIRDDTN